MSQWSEVVDGTAIGPVETITVAGTSVSVTALWDDESGVGVSIDVSPDAVFRPSEVVEVRALIDRMLSLNPPA